jgi:putative molybdopterin biosynthesis protein
VTMRKEFRRLISPEEARSIVLGHLPAVEEETVSLDCAQGLVLAGKVVSEIDVPGFNRASMDGYAVKATDVVEAREDRPVRLSLVGSVPIGSRAQVQVGPLQAAEISTGSMMPDGADAVVIIEQSEEDGKEVLVRKPVYAGENVLAAGSDIMFGDAVLLPGTILSARQIGLLAALGRDRVKVRRLRVGIASTGNELVEPGTALQPGQIYDINSYSIAAAVQECSATPIRYGILPDDHDSMAKALQKISQECSMTLVSGSTSAGVGDMVYQILDEIGETIFHGVNLKPGKPTLFGSISGKPILGLPGYPTSALTVFSQLAAPAIRKALGRRAQGMKRKGILAKPVRTEGRHQLLSVGISGDRVYSVDKGSGSITTLAQADGVIEIPSQVEYLEAGQEVEVQLFGELVEPDLVIAGENCPFLEQLAESLPLQIKFMTSGIQPGIVAVEDGLADIACISGAEEQGIPGGLALIRGYARELGLMSRDPGILNMDGQKTVSMVVWPRNSEMSRIFHAALKDAGIDPGVANFGGVVRTHGAVAAAVASGRAHMGFGARMVAEEAGLYFRKMASDKIDFLVAESRLEDEGIKAFVSVLGSEDFRRNLPADY